MRRLSFREICKTLFLCAASVNLGISSGLIPMGILFAAMFVYIAFRGEKVPRYRKVVVYGAIVPFAIWWLLSPKAENDVSPWLVFIPAYYLLFLAFLQQRSLGNGGHEAFVAFDGCAALMLSCFHAGRFGLILAIVALLLAVAAYGRPNVALYKRFLFLLLFVGLGGISIGGVKYWRYHGHSRGHFVANYMEKTRIMGFDPVVKLGSFERNYSGKYESAVALRVWDSLAPEYMRAAVYEKYIGGIWKLPAAPLKKLYPSGYMVDYAVFEVEDSLAFKESRGPVWVQASVDNFGFLFAPGGAAGVAAKNADSLDLYGTGIFAKANGRRNNWYYFVQNDGDESAKRFSPDSAALQIPVKLLGFVDSVSAVVGLDSLPADSVPYRIGRYLAENFTYSLQVEALSRNHDEPLRAFWMGRRGYCEYYATLSIMLLRHCGIPARYVTGFVHPERVHGRSYAIYRRHSSHAWVEVFLNGGWMIFDPTPTRFLIVGGQGSWLSSKWEGLRGSVSHLLHQVMEGGWRKVVDSWQGETERILASVWFRVLAVLALTLLVSLRVARHVRGRRRDCPAASAFEEWVRKLEVAEKTLARLGWTRKPGETVAAFERRCRASGLNSALCPQDKSRGRAQKKSEERLLQMEACLQALCDYESNRWRSSLKQSPVKQSPANQSPAK